LNKWIVGARPRTLPAAIAPVLVATSLAASDADFGMAGLALVVSLALQSGSTTPMITPMALKEPTIIGLAQLGWLLLV